MTATTRSTTRTRTLAVGLAAVAVCCAGACGGGSDDAAPAQTVTVTAAPTDSAGATPSAADSSSAEPSSAEPSSAAAAPTTATTSPSATPTGSTIPGTYTKESAALKLGQMATVPYTLSKVTGPIGITVTKIDKGVPADLAPLKLGDKANGLTPYYIRITVTNVAGGPFAYSSVPSTDGILGDGSEATNVISFGRFAKCDSRSAGRDFTTKGATYETCRLALAGPGAAVVGANYSSSYSGGDNPPAGTEYSRNPIVWK